MFIDIHVLQSLPSSNINRDETGSPKTAYFGGVTRARVSSQAWKYAMRKAFQAYMEKQEAATGDDYSWIRSLRTRRGPIQLAHDIQKLNPDMSDKDAQKLSDTIFERVGLEVNDEKSTQPHCTKVGLMISLEQLQHVAKYAVDNTDFIMDSKNKKKAKTVLNGLFSQDKALDLTLFGRMVVNDEVLSVDGTSQVAHAISTHEIEPEFDYFAAVDDVEGAKGAMMLDDREFNSATYYRYGNVNLTRFLDSFDNNENAIEGIKLFIKSFILSMPTGEQNAYANRVDPQYVMITLRNDSPVSLVNSFEVPVQSDGGYMQPSINRLEAQYKKTNKFHEPVVANYILTTEKSDLDNQTDNLTDLTNKIMTKIKEVALNENTND